MLSESGRTDINATFTGSFRESTKGIVIEETEEEKGEEIDKSQDNEENSNIEANLENSEVELLKALENKKQIELSR